jgi:hypothetical protein
MHVFLSVLSYGYELMVPYRLRRGLYHAYAIFSPLQLLANLCMLEAPQPLRKPVSLPTSYRLPAAGHQTLLHATSEKILFYLKLSSLAAPLYFHSLFVSFRLAPPRQAKPNRPKNLFAYHYPTPTSCNTTPSTSSQNYQTLPPLPSSNFSPLAVDKPAIALDP